MEKRAEKGEKRERGMKRNTHSLTATGEQQFKILICCDLIYGSIYVDLIERERESVSTPSIRT